MKELYMYVYIEKCIPNKVYLCVYFFDYMII